MDQNINLLWPILSALTGEPLAQLPYDERLPRLLAHGFGLWDVLGACEREGSLDSAIRQPAANDFARLRELCPLLETVGFNGQTSGKFAPQFDAAGYRTVVLPSTSPAHAAMSFEQKLTSWRRLLAG
ncbi:DNA-deoxyinosine glycosylase [Duganella sp. Dugasp56]|uniref:DNA-deoxyinosine glycosylase n=1 Tax=Duganella sp. Dugasp56 TaxID=3243046 RepID=UPI0039AE9E1A